MNQEEIDKLIDLVVDVVYDFTGYEKKGKYYVLASIRDVEDLMNLLAKMGKVKRVRDMTYEIS